MEKQQFVAYYRVSTVRQGQSGLGLEAQQESVKRFIAQRSGEIIAEYVEIETGKGKNALSKRPQLSSALEDCKKTKAVLVIAKLDRLARNVHFISGLMEANVDLIAVDCPTKDRFRLHLEACFAEEETRRISIRTKQALSACKARGKKLGKNGKVLAKQNKAIANKFAKSIKPVIKNLREEGVHTVRAITEELNKRNIPSAKGGSWSPGTTYRLLRRLV